MNFYRVSHYSKEFIEPKILEKEKKDFIAIFVKRTFLNERNMSRVCTNFVKRLKNFRRWLDYHSTGSEHWNRRCSFSFVESFRLYMLAASLAHWHVAVILPRDAQVSRRDWTKRPNVRRIDENVFGEQWGTSEGIYSK